MLKLWLLCWACCRLGWCFVLLFWMGQQDDVVEEVAEVPVFVRLALEAGQHGAKGSCYEFLIVVFHRAYLFQRDVEQMSWPSSVIRKPSSPLPQKREWVESQSSTTWALWTPARAP